MNQTSSSPYAPTRAALRYLGGKWKIAKWIISHFPPHTTYVEPFGGAASVLLHKIPAFIEVYNDLDQEVVTFFQVLREKPAELLAAIELTPYSRAEFLQAQEDVTEPIDNTERARRLFIRAWQGRGRTGIKEPGGWRFMSRATRSQTPVDDWTNTHHLWAIARRLREIQIECDDALKVIKRYDTPETLFYCDPPYPQVTRTERWGTAYSHEYTEDDHQQLAQLLHQIEGMAIISSYPSDLYNQLYSDWTKTSHPGQRGTGNRTPTECLWISPRTVAMRELYSHTQLPLEEEGNG